MGTWVREKPWSVTWARWFVIFAIVPFILLQAASHLDIQNVAWAFGGYFAAMWLIVLTLVIRPTGVPMTTYVSIAVFTGLVGTLLAIELETIFASVFSADAVTPSGLLTNLFGVALPEEAVKLLPLYLFLYRGKAPIGPLTMAYAGALSGLAFGTAEAVAYSVSYSSQAEAGYLGSDDLVVAQVWRLVSGPMFHACLTGITGYFLGVAKHHPSVTQALVLTGLGVSVVLHALYNTFGDDWVGTGVAIVTVLAFVSYVRTGEEISQRLGGQEQADDFGERPPEARSKATQPVVRR